MDTKQKIALVVLILVVILLISMIGPDSSIPSLLKKTGLDLSTWQAIPGPVNKITIDTQTGAPAVTNGTATAVSFQYRLVDTTIPVENTSGQYWYNSRLEKVLSGGQTQVVIASLKNKFSNILTQQNQQLAEYYFPPNSDILFFALKNRDTSGNVISGRLYRYNVTRDEIRNLSANSYLYKVGVPSPFDRRVLLGIDDENIRTFQRLYLINLESDSARLLIELRGNETLASYADQYGELYSADINWINQSTAEYGVYDKSKTQNNFQTKNFGFIEKRKVSF